MDPSQPVYEYESSEAANTMRLSYRRNQAVGIQQELFLLGRAMTTMAIAFCTVLSRVFNGISESHAFTPTTGSWHHDPSSYYHRHLLPPTSCYQRLPSVLCGNPTNLSPNHHLHQETKTTSSSMDECIIPQTWHVVQAAQTLASSVTSMKDHPLTPRVVPILKEWGKTWGGTDGSIDDQNETRIMRGILNKANLLHEVEESMMALGTLVHWMEGQERNEQYVVQPLVLVDVCCGKGICALLASYLLRGNPRVSKIVMLDSNDQLDWSPIDIVNGRAAREGRPTIHAHQCNLFEMDHMFDFFTKVASADPPTTNGSTSSNGGPYPHQLAMIGIHLCRNLSPTLIGIVNALGPDVVPFFSLAPCCLPRVVLKGNKSERLLPIAQFETPMQRQARLLSITRRQKARRRKSPCLLCESTSHRVQQCPKFEVLPRKQQETVIQQARMQEACWKCGALGHTKKDCPSTQTSSTPILLPRPVTQLDVSNVMETTHPFSSYCHLLTTTIEGQRDVQVLETELQNTPSSRREHRNNWNRDRKTICIVASKG